MTSEELLKLVETLKERIIALIELGIDDKRSSKELLTINNMFDQLGLTVQQVLPPELAKSYFYAVDEATDMLNEAGMNVQGKAMVNGTVSPTFNTQAHVDAVKEIVNDSMMDLNAAFRTAKQNFNAEYEKAVQGVRKDIADGLIDGRNREKIIKRVYETFSENGFTSFTTVDGKNLPLEFYARTVTRTKMTQARNHGHLNRYTEAGVNLVYVTGREPTCGECAKYRNRVFCLDGSDKRFPHVDCYNVFPIHPNCNCKIRPYVIKYKSQADINKEVQHSKSFNPEKDPRTAEQRKKYETDQEKKRIARAEDKQYAKMVSVLGDKAPKSIGAYRRIKRNNPERFAELQSMMRGG